MTELILWKNQEIKRLRRDMEQTLQQCCRGLGVPYSMIQVTEAVSFDLSETENELVLTAELPNIVSENLEISVSDDTVTIRGQQKEATIENGEDYRRVEHRSGSFSRSLTLPCRVKMDETKATFRNGVLKIVMPKLYPRGTRSTRIEIK
jgi:HSP20 family protein